MIQTFKKNYLYIISVGLTLLFVLLNISAEPLFEWDESRNGINAIEMMRNGKFFNLYYAGQPDNWNAKPPLLIWLITIMYKLFGTNEFALRFPSAIAAIITIHYLFKLVTLFKDKIYAFFVCICLISVSGFMGVHVCKTGDFDALLLAFLMGGTYYFIRYSEQDGNKNIYLASLFFSLAFLTKGFSFLIVLPALFIYSLFKLKKSLFNKHLIFASSIVLLIGILWISINLLTGEEFQNQQFGRNSLEVMLKNDILNRFTGDDFQEATPKTWDHYLYFFIYLESKFSFWYIFFYISILIGVLKLRNKKMSLSEWLFKIKNDQLIFLSVCIIATITLFLSMVQNIHFWYMTPIVPFLAIISCSGLMMLWKNQGKILKIFIVLFCLTNLTIRFIKIKNHQEAPMLIEQTKQQIKKADKVIISSGYPNQDILLYFNFLNSNVDYQLKNNQINLGANEILLAPKSNFKQNKNDYQIIWEDADYLVLKGK